MYLVPYLEMSENQLSCWDISFLYVWWSKVVKIGAISMMLSSLRSKQPERIAREKQIYQIQTLSIEVFT